MAWGMLGVTLVLLVSGATQAQAQPTKPGGLGGVQVASQPGEAAIILQRLGWEEKLEDLEHFCKKAKCKDSSNANLRRLDYHLKRLRRWCPHHPKACDEMLKDRSFWQTSRAYFRCASKIVVFVGSNAVAIAKLKKSGGVWKVAKRTWQAPSKEAKIKVLVAAVGEYVGVEEVAQAC